MRLNTTYELSLVLDSEKFNKVLNRAYGSAEYLDGNDGEYIDRSLVPEGIKIIYRDSQYKKKIKLLVNSNRVLDSDEPDPDKLIRKLAKRVDRYFNAKYRVEDFSLSEMVLSTDIDVGSRENVAAYLMVLQRVGRVKGFSPASYECFNSNTSFCLSGNSNGVSFLLYDLERLLAGKFGNTDINRRKLKSMLDESKGILQAEVRLTKPKSIREHTDLTETAGQIAELADKTADIFLGSFTQIIPFGDFVKKDKAVEIIRCEVKDNILKRKMLYLLELIPEKKSLLLAQKALNYRKIEDVMDAFAALDLSPVTLSKRHGVKQLRNLYAYL